ncbi:MAG: hypothetical protein HYY14_04910 [Candidatus Omnitrophica bacterium]|nr:hypothetical protein [Candidatus Omnitrophota bacterium]
MTVAVLSFGIVLVFEAFFITLDVSKLATSRLDALMWIDDKSWELHEKLLVAGALEEAKAGGDFVRDHKPYSWETDITTLDGPPQLYRLNMKVRWKSGWRNAVSSRQAYYLSLPEPAGEST